MPGFLSGLKAGLHSDAAKIGGGTAAGGLLGGLAGYGASQFFAGKEDTPVAIAGHNFTQAQLYTAGGAMVGALAGGGGAAFFTHLQNKKKRDYVIVLDKSAGMGGGRLDEAKAAIMQLAPHVCGADPDGVALIVFADKAEKKGNIKDANTLLGLLNGLQPGGNSDLAEALQSAFADALSGASKKGTSVLVMTAGLPQNKDQVVNVLRDAANRVKGADDLVVTFIQVGDDPNATAFLKMLDTDLKAKYDLCSTIKDEDMKKAGLY